MKWKKVGKNGDDSIVWCMPFITGNGSLNEHSILVRHSVGGTTCRMFATSVGVNADGIIE